MFELNKLQASRVFYYFEEISKIPRGSKNTKAISDYLVAFAVFNNLEYRKDENNNVIIYKKAYRGYENSQTIILQAHMDMVCEKGKNVEHDFNKDGIEIIYDNGVLKADGTTLGADDGIGIAFSLSVLESKTLKHPNLEVVFTADEEIGLIGAKKINTEFLSGKYLINLDSENESCFYVGCAGAIGGVVSIPLAFKKKYGSVYRIRISGLLSGHSGIDIDKNRGNAIILMGRLLYKVKDLISIISLNGGENENVISREAEAIIMVDENVSEKLKKIIDDYSDDIKKEYYQIDDSVNVFMDKLEKMETDVLTLQSSVTVLTFLMLYPNGVYKKCGYLDNVVETSCNIGMVKTEKEYFLAFISIRSCLETAKEFMWNKIYCLSELLGCKLKKVAEYSAWEYNRDSKLGRIMIDAYRNVYGKTPEIKVIHAGLECAVFKEKMPELECISIGPDIYNIHTVQECVSMISVNRVWIFLVKVLDAMCKT